MQEFTQTERDRRKAGGSNGEGEVLIDGVEATDIDPEEWEAATQFSTAVPPIATTSDGGPWQQLRRELFEIRELLVTGH